MDKSEYLRLLSEASINDTTKFRTVDPERPKTRGRPPKHYHPLLQKEKDLESTVRRILPKPISDSVRPTGSRLAPVWFTQDPQRSSGYAPHLICHTNVQLWIGEMVRRETTAFVLQPVHDNRHL